MSKLPTNIHPSYEIFLPATEKKISFRPFLVKERKILQMAVETNEQSEVMKATTQVLENCIETPDIDIKKLPMIDAEWFSINLIAKSKGEIVTPQFKCENIVDNKKCGNKFKVQVNLTEISIENLKKQKDRRVLLSSNLGIQFKYPTYEIVISEEPFFDKMIKCIDFIFDGENIYNAKDYLKEDLEYFIDSLNNEQMNKIETFFTELPILKKNVKHTCEKCGFEHDLSMEGYSSFFI